MVVFKAEISEEKNKRRNENDSSVNELFIGSWSSLWSSD